MFFQLAEDGASVLCVNRLAQKPPERLQAGPGCVTRHRG